MYHMERGYDKQSAASREVTETIDSSSSLQ
jgi:hypothetical protein